MKNSKESTRKHYLFKDTSSVYSESFQNLQVNLDFSFIDQKERVIAVTSPSPSEGKSTVVANLAYIYAKKDFKVLLIDLDLRKANIHRFFGLENTLGVTDYCADKATREEIVQSFENLDVISSGSSSPFPSKILESQVLAELIEEAKTKYDYIFIDTPPVLVASDALLISRFVTNYLVVIKHAHTKKNDFDEVVRQFTNNNLEISGVVFDSVASKQKGYYKYNYRYGYGKK